MSCLLHVLSMKCLFDEISCQCNVLFIKSPVDAISTLLNVLSLQCLDYAMMSCCLWNVHGNAMFFMKCSVYAMPCFWNVILWNEMRCQCNRLFMICPVYAMSCYLWNVYGNAMFFYEMFCRCNVLLFMKCPWQCNVFLWNVLSMQCSFYEMKCNVHSWFNVLNMKYSVNAKSLDAKRIEYILGWNLLEKKCKTAILLYCFHTAGVLHIFVLYTFWSPEHHFIENLKLILKENQIMK